MGDMSEFTLKVRLFLKAYPWRRIDPVPWTASKKPLAECRLALVSTAGFVLRQQEPFDASILGGDVSFREIPSEADSRDLVDAHRSESFDHNGMVEDPNLAFPLDRARELVEAGRIGSLTPHHLSFMGSITAPGRLIRKTAPRAAVRLDEEGADVALLIPG